MKHNDNRDGGGEKPDITSESIRQMMPQSCRHLIAQLRSAALFMGSDGRPTPQLLGIVNRAKYQPSSLESTEYNRAFCQGEHARRELFVTTVENAFLLMVGQCRMRLERQSDVDLVMTSILFDEYWEQWPGFQDIQQMLDWMTGRQDDGEMNRCWWFMRVLIAVLRGYPPDSYSAAMCCTVTELYRFAKAVETELALAHQQKPDQLN